jgi:hypothetical protein
MPRLGPGARAEIGAAVLAAAEAVDTRLVDPRLAVFAETHRRYMAAQRKVEAAEAQLASARVRLGRCDAAQDECVDVLARAVVSDGQPRANPFRAFGLPSPASMQRLAMAAEAQAIHELVTALRGRAETSAATLRAAAVAMQAARSVELALLPMVKLEAAARVARHTRDVIGQRWDGDLAALKRAAVAAIDDGAPNLHRALFGRHRRAAGTRAKPRPPRAAATRRCEG